MLISSCREINGAAFFHTSKPTCRRKSPAYCLEQLDNNAVVRIQRPRISSPISSKQTARLPAGRLLQRVKEPAKRQNSRQIILASASPWRSGSYEGFTRVLCRICPGTGCFDLLRDPNPTVSIYADRFGPHRLCGPFNRCQTVKKPFLIV